MAGMNTFFTLTLVVLLLAQLWSCIPPPGKEVPNQGEEAERDIEGLDDFVNLELTPGNVEHSKQAGSHTNRSGNKSGLGKWKQEIRAQHDPKNFAIKQADWESMMKNVAWTKELIREALPSPVSSIDLATMEEILGRLEGFYELIETIYGPQTVSNAKSAPARRPASISKNSLELEEYKQSIETLASILTRRSDLDNDTFHVRVAWNKSILQTLNYIHKYRLIPAELVERFERDRKNPAFLKWLAQESYETFRPNTRYWSRLHRNYAEVEFLQNHPQLSSIAEIFNELERREQNLVLFYRLKLDIETCYGGVLLHQAHTIPIEAQWHLSFLAKMEKIVSKELQLTNSQYYEQLANGITEVKDELMNMKDFLIRPVIQPQHFNLPVSNLLRLSYDILDFAQKKYGTKFIEKIGLTDQMNPSTIEYQRNFDFMRAIGQLDLQMSISTSYVFFLLTELHYGRETGPDVWSKGARLLFSKLVKSANGYKQTLVQGFQKDPGWKEFLETNPFFSAAKKLRDSKTHILPRLYVILKAVATNRLSADQIASAQKVFAGKKAIHP